MENATKTQMKKLSMEDYLGCFDHRRHEILTVNKLNQIIGMHGFKKFTRGIKKDVLEAVKSMDLMDLRRSTVLNDVSGDGASLTLEEIIEDLRDLNWQECHVTSLLTQGAADSASSTTTTSNATAPVKGKLPNKTKYNLIAETEAPVKKRKLSKASKLRLLAEIEADSSAASTGTGTAKPKRPKKATKESILKVGAASSGISTGTIVAAGGTTTRK